MSSDPYDTIAKHYDRLIEPLNIRLKGHGLALAPPRRDQRVLDMGCGTGTLLERYRDGGSAVWGIDASPAMLAVARRRLGPKASLLLGDVTRTPLAEASFDLVTVTMVLHEMPPEVRSAAVDEARRLIRPGGQLLAIDYHRGPLGFPRGWLLRGLTTVIERAAGREHWRGYRHFLAAGALPALASSHGLTVRARRIVGRGTFGVFLLESERSADA